MEESSEKMVNVASFVYYASWSAYGRSFYPWMIPTKGVTHVTYAFANISAQTGGISLGDPYVDIQRVYESQGDKYMPTENLHGNLLQLFLFKKRNPTIKVGIGIGGWTGSSLFSTIASTSTSRTTFVQSAIAFALAYGMDYIDLDWEYPGGGGLPGNQISPEDTNNFVLLGAEFSRQFSLIKQPLFLTASVSGALPTITHYNFPGMAPYFKYIQLMTYDFNGSWSKIADHQSNTISRTPSVPSMLSAINFVLSTGFPSGQLVVGVPLYGRGFSSCNGILQPFSGGGQGSWEPGVYDYKVLPLQGALVLWEKASEQSLSYDPNQKQLITYDTTTSLSYKLQYVDQFKLGGVMFWEVSGDSSSDKNSLIKFVYSWFGSRLDSTEANLCFPTSPYPNINSYCTLKKSKTLFETSDEEDSGSHKIAILNDSSSKNTNTDSSASVNNDMISSFARESSCVDQRDSYSMDDSSILTLSPNSSPKPIDSLSFGKNQDQSVKKINVDLFISNDSDRIESILGNPINQEGLTYARAHFNYTQAHEYFIEKGIPSLSIFN